MSMLIVLAVIAGIIGLATLAHWAFNKYCCYSSAELDAMATAAATQTPEQRRRNTAHLQGAAEGLRRGRERNKRGEYFGLEGLL